MKRFLREVDRRSRGLSQHLVPPIHITLVDYGEDEGAECLRTRPYTVHAGRSAHGNRFCARWCVFFGKAGAETLGVTR